MRNRISFMLCSIILVWNSAAGHHQQSLSLFFESNSCRLSDNAVKQLSVLSGDLKKAPFIHLLISGHCDADGGVRYNEKLSRKRVESVCQVLIQNGIDKAKIIKEFSGESVPIAGNCSPEGKLKNRRVDISIQYPENRQENYIKDFMLNVQYFQAYAGKGIHFRVKKGTLNSIHALFYETVNGKKNQASVRWDWIELCRNSDFSIYALSAEPNHRILGRGSFFSTQKSVSEMNSGCLLLKSGGWI
jgi:hypothetical protein